MSGDYLWDGSGEPDPEIQRLEAVLAPLRHRRAAAPLPLAFAARPAVFRGGWLAAAAAVLLATASVMTIPHPTAKPERGWGLTWLDETAATGVTEPARLVEGQWIETRSRHARLDVGDIGRVRLEPATRVGLVDAGKRWHRLSLARGTLHATIWAPPGRFLVDTPAALAVDLGCQYTLEVRGDGSGLLRVEVGWVGFEERGVQALVPGGAACAMQKGKGPGTPYYETAPEALRLALDVFDFGPAPSRAAALERALDAARPRDALSLWHLLARATGEERGRVFDRLQAFVPPPEGVTRSGVVSGDGAMRDAWWDELGLGSSEFWRGWTSAWDGAAARRRPR